MSRPTARLALAQLDVRAKGDPKPTTAVTPPRRSQGPYSWDLEQIRGSRDDQLRGQFSRPVRLAEAMRTDDALFTAYQARVATQGAITLGWSPSDSDVGRAWGERAKASIRLPQHVRESLLGTMANHGIAIGYVDQQAIDTAAGPTVVMTLTEWPLEHVRFNSSDNTLETRTVDQACVKITHGDGRWVVFRKFGIAPWTQDAAVLPGALLWAAHAEGLSSWAGASAAHGRPAVIGTLPEGVNLTDPDGTQGLTQEALAFLQMLSAVVNGENGAGVAPFGSSTQYLSNGSNAWQVFKELITNRESAAARIYLGTDAILGSRGGAPGVDVAALFGIATTRIQGDLEALERGFREGVIEPWFAMHGAPLVYAPVVHYELPDIDADKRSEQEAAAIERFAAAIKALKDSGVEVTQAVANELRRLLGVSVPTNLAAQENRAVPLPLAPTDIARVVRIREARAAQGLPPLGDERDDMTIAQLEAQSKPAAPPGGPVPFSRFYAWAAPKAGKARKALEGDRPRDADGDGKINEAEDPPAVKKARQRLAREVKAYEAAAYIPPDLTKHSLKSLRALPLDDESDERRVKALKEFPAFRDTGRVTSNDGQRGLTIYVDEDGVSLNDGRHRFQAAKELGRDDVWGTVTVPGSGKVLYEGPIPLTEKGAAAARERAAKVPTKKMNDALGKLEAAHLEAADEAQSQADWLSTEYSNAVKAGDTDRANEIRKARREVSSIAAHHERRAADIKSGRSGGDAEDDSDEPTSDAPSKGDYDTAKAIVTGPKGGRYYVAPSGERVYL